MRRLTQAVLASFIIQFIMWILFFYVFEQYSKGWWVLFIPELPSVLWVSLRMPSGLSSELTEQIRKQVIIESFVIGFVLYTIIIYGVLWIKNKLMYAIFTR